MRSGDTQARPNWRAIVTFYVLACALSWPFFWWRDVHTGSWKAFPLPEEIKDLTWGPAVAALLVFWIMPATRRWAVSFFGPSWRRRSLLCRADPVAFIGYRIHSGALSYKLLYYLMIGGVSTLGEELGWRGFLQGSLRPLGRVRGYLLVALMWEMWHFTSHLKGTLTEVVSRCRSTSLSSLRLRSFWALSSSARILFCSPSRYTSGSISLSTVVEPT